MKCSKLRDIILVHTGTYKLKYKEDIMIDRPLTLIGENRTGTIIDDTDNWISIIKVTTLH